MNVIDLFAGAGGLSLGFIKAGFNIKKAVEFDPKIAYTYKKNHPNVDVIVDDIKNIDQTSIFSKNDVDVIIGGPPCQGFSMAGSRIRSGFMNDPRNYLFKHYFNVVKAVKPKVFVMENVKGIQTMSNGDIFKEILHVFSDKDLLDGDSYNIYYTIVKAMEFGIPQKRERMIIIGILNNTVDFNKLWYQTKTQVLKEYPQFFDKVNVYDAIGNLNDTSADGIIKNPKPETEYQKFLESNNEILMNHNSTNHSKKAIARMDKIGKGENFTVLDEKINSVHSGSYGRLSWNDLAPTITTRFDTPAGGRYIHPEMNRTLTPREAARIQSFPDDFIFYGSKTSICKQIGNAVPPKISFFLARLVKNIMKETDIDE